LRDYINSKKVNLAKKKYLAEMVQAQLRKTQSTERKLFQKTFLLRFNDQKDL
jgi:hypothetical protein